LSDILAYLIKRGDSGLEDLSIGKVSINGIISFEVSDICFENPSGFPDGKVLVIKKLKFDVDPYSIFSDKILVYEVVLSGIVLNWLDDGKNVNFYEIIKEIGGKKNGGKWKKGESKLFIKLLSMKNIVVSVESKIFNRKKYGIRVDNLEFRDITFSGGGFFVGEALKQSIGILKKHIVRSIFKKNRKRLEEKLRGKILKGIKDKFLKKVLKF